MLEQKLSLVEEEIQDSNTLVVDGLLTEQQCQELSQLPKVSNTACSIDSILFGPFIARISVQRRHDVQDSFICSLAHGQTKSDQQSGRSKKRYP